MIRDFTKPLQGKKFKKFRDLIMGNKKKKSSQFWNPKILDSEIDDNKVNWYDSSDIDIPGYFNYLFDKTGTYRHQEIATTQNYHNTNYDFYCQSYLDNNLDDF